MAGFFEFDRKINVATVAMIAGAVITIGVALHRIEGLVEQNADQEVRIRSLEGQVIPMLARIDERLTSIEKQVSK